VCSACGGVAAPTAGLAVGLVGGIGRPAVGRGAPPRPRARVGPHAGSCGAALLLQAAATKPTGASLPRPCHPIQGKGIDPMSSAAEVRPFRVDVPEDDLVDLRRRVAATRWPAPETVPDQSQGVQLSKIEELVRYWGTAYDWRTMEAKLNALPQFMTNIDGLDIHFIHVRSPHRPAADHHPWLARLDPGTAEGHWSAHRPANPWWAGG